MIADSPSEPKTKNQKPQTYPGEFITHSPEETFALAKRIGEQLKGGEVFLLKGELGAGKTVFAKGLAAGLGVDPSDVTSPSFTLINVHEGRLRFFHIDLYRLEAGLHRDLGLQEIFENEKAVTVIEWAERLAEVPSDGIEVEIVYVSHAERQIHIDCVPASSL
ncbi:MAG: tRNA (adenosine(37)-N6)-threonylcarbamoyltransferase complex ATPase subunit type 1 TsaE [Blastocatellia bacterium]